MLTAHRFTNVPTNDTRMRLEVAMANERPIARGETHRGAVVAIQYALADLSGGYMTEADVDGFFGPRTHASVVAFQRDYGLVADGIVGRQTMSQLDELYSSDVIRKPRGRSIHIGVDRVDANHYGGEFALASCVNDARKMREIAENLGYDTATLENDGATVSAFTGFMRGAISDLIAGDSVLITFSGHGSQIPNISDDQEPDSLDETLCFYDRMLVDDEFYALLGQFRKGVRVHAVFDSCHSATAAKSLELAGMSKDVIIQQERTFYHTKTLGTLKELKTTVMVLMPANGGGEAEEVSGQPIARNNLDKALEGEKPKLGKAPQPVEDRSEDLAELFADLQVANKAGPAKTIQLFMPIYERNKELYDAIKNVVGPQENQQLACSVVTLSACQDSQTTPAGQVLSLFTSNISTALESGGSNGSYRQLHRALMDVGPTDSTPAMNTYGSAVAEARSYERPLAF